jgi:hypothetical protein
MLRDNGVNIISTGGETADVGDLVRTGIPPLKHKLSLSPPLDWQRR